MWTIGIILAIILAVTAAPKRDDGGAVTQGGDISATALRVGDCINNLRDSNNVQSLPGVPCSQPHEGEVFAVFDLPAGAYPGGAAVEDQVTKECNDRITSYSPGSAQDPDVGLFSVYPLEQNWNSGDRQVVCIATAKSGATTGRSRAGDAAPAPSHFAPLAITSHPADSNATWPKLIKSLTSTKRRRYAIGHTTGRSISGSAEKHRSVASPTKT